MSHHYYTARAVVFSSWGVEGAAPQRSPAEET